MLIIIALVILFVIYAIRQYIKYENEAKRLQAEAEQGNVQALYELGKLCVERGRYSEAVSWFEKASEKGHLEATNAANNARHELRKKEDAKAAKERDRLKHKVDYAIEQALKWKCPPCPYCGSKIKWEKKDSDHEYIYDRHFCSKDNGLGCGQWEPIIQKTRK